MFNREEFNEILRSSCSIRERSGGVISCETLRNKLGADLARGGFGIRSFMVF